MSKVGRYTHITCSAYPRLLYFFDYKFFMPQSLIVRRFKLLLSPCAHYNHGNKMMFQQVQLRKRVVGIFVYSKMDNADGCKIMLWRPYTHTHTHTCTHTHTHAHTHTHIHTCAHTHTHKVISTYIPILYLYSSCWLLPIPLPPPPPHKFIALHCMYIGLQSWCGF